VLAGLDVDDADVQRMRQGQPPTATNRLAAVYTYARSLAVNRGAIDDAVRAEAWYAGIDHRLALDITTEATFATLIGYVDALTERVELDGFLADNAWVPTAA
jgi:uncharacterized protein YciW